MRTMKNSGIEWIGEIPAGWKVKKIKHSFSIIAGATPKSEVPEFWDGDIAWITPADYKTADVYVAGGKRNLSQAGYDSCGTTLIPSGSIVFSKRAPIGSVAINTNDLCTNQGCLSCVPKCECVTKYFYYMMSVFTEIFNLFGTGTTFKEISADNFANFSLPFPEIIEQHQIVSYLDQKCAEIDAVIAKTKATIEEYRKLRQSIVTDAVTKGIRSERALKNTGVEWIRVVPVDWEMVRGKGLFVETNARSTTGEEELLTVSQYTGVTPRSQKNVNMFEAESLEGYKICKVGDIAANTMWLWAGAIGVSEYEGVISPSYNLYRQSEENYNPKYLDYLLRCTPLVQCYESMSTGIRASRLRLYPQQFLSIRFPVPPMAEQVEIVAYLDKKCAEMDALIARKTALLTEMESYKKSVIYEYVTGKKEVS